MMFLLLHTNHACWPLNVVAVAVPSKPLENHHPLFLACPSILLHQETPSLINKKKKTDEKQIHVLIVVNCSTISHRVFAVKNPACDAEIREMLESQHQHQREKEGGARSVHVSAKSGTAPALPNRAGGRERRLTTE